MTDDDGHLAWFVAAAIGGALFDTAAYMIGCAISGEKMTWSGVGKAALTGAISGVAFGAIGKGVKLAATAIRASKTAKKFTSAGIRIINSKYANKVYKGVKFNKYGFPNFSKVAKYTTKIKGLTGNYAKDSAMANAKIGLSSTPKGYTWHHVEDGVNMMLVPTKIHQAVRHTGGAAILKRLQ